MPEALKAQFNWPKNSWTVLQRIIRAWYAAEEGGAEVTQKKIADMAGVQPSQVSINKAFLQDIGIIQKEGIALTEAGKRLGVGLSNENQRAVQQGLQQLIRDSWILKDLLDLIRGRGSLNESDFEIEVSLRTRQGKGNLGFTIGVSVLQDILTNSGLIGIEGNVMRPNKGQIEEEKKILPKDASQAIAILGPESGLRRIPIPVSASSVWYIQVGDNPEEGEIDKFIEMQKLIFGKK